MKKLLWTLILFALMGRQATADVISVDFDDFKTAAVQIDDKLFTYISGGLNFDFNTTVDFESNVIPGLYSMNVQFDPGLVGLTTIDLDYSVQITDPQKYFAGLELDSQISSLGANFDVRKDFYASSGHVNLITSLTSANGSSDFVVGNFGQLLYIHVTATIPGTGGINNLPGELDSFRDGYLQVSNLVPTPNITPVPEPGSLVLAGFGAFGLIGMTWFRRVRADKT